MRVCGFDGVRDTASLANMRQRVSRSTRPRVTGTLRAGPK